MFSGPESGEMPDKDAAHYPMPERRQRILLVDADAMASSALADYLRQRDFDVLIAHDGEQIAAIVTDWHPNLVLTDIELPGLDGFEVCRTLHAHELKVPIIIFSARTDEFDQVLGLELGADDYLIKPMQPRLVLARIKAVLRRVGANDSESEQFFVASGQSAFTRPTQFALDVTKGKYFSVSSTDAKAIYANRADVRLLEFGRLRIDEVARQVNLGNVIVNISAAEFDLLWLLASNAGRVLPRQEILKALRGLEYDGVDRSIDSRVSRLRRKLGDDLGPSSHIKTVRPQGYLFTPTPW
jgi:two-component system, OmpR family, response regulator